MKSIDVWLNLLEISQEKCWERVHTDNTDLSVSHYKRYRIRAISLNMPTKENIYICYMHQLLHYDWNEI